MEINSSNPLSVRVISPDLPATLLEQAPEEIALEVLSHLGPADLAKVSRVSHTFNRLANDDSLWKPLALRTISNEQLPESGFKSALRTWHAQRKEAGFLQVAEALRMLPLKEMYSAMSPLLAALSDRTQVNRQVSPKGETLLHVATGRYVDSLGQGKSLQQFADLKELIEILLVAGADPHKQDGSGTSPAKRVLQSGSEPLIAIFREAGVALDEPSGGTTRQCDGCTIV